MMFQPRSRSRLRCFHWFWAVSWTDVYLGKLGSSWDQQHNKTPPLKLGLVNLLEHNPPSMQHKIDIGQNFNVWFYFWNALSELEKVQGWPMNDAVSPLSLSLPLSLFIYVWVYVHIYSYSIISEYVHLFIYIEHIGFLELIFFCLETLSFRIFWEIERSTCEPGHGGPVVPWWEKTIGNRWSCGFLYLQKRGVFLFGGGIGFWQVGGSISLFISVWYHLHWFREL